ncbi:MAG: nitric oxide reductase NorD protein [Cyclobacteriaceae bacterium]|jgi:nitric oxide reductase NorD protein
MIDFLHVAPDLAKLNRSTAASFESVSRVLQGRILDSELLPAWADICHSMATSGWHGWESTDHYLLLSDDLFTHGGSELLLDVGRYGLSLCGFSVEPCVSYLCGLRVLLDEGAVERRSGIESTGERLIGKYTHAANLVASYYKTAFAISVIETQQSLEHWLCIADDIVLGERDGVLQFFALSQLPTTVSWAYVRQLHDCSEMAAVAYLRVQPTLAGVLNAEQQARLAQRLLFYAALPRPVSDLLDQLATVFTHLAPQERDNLLLLLEQVDDVLLASTLLAITQQLPMFDANILLEWIQEGLELAVKQPAAALAYLGLESARSTQCLQRLQGQVYLADVQRMLQFYTEAFVGSRLRLASRDELDAEHLAGTDGTVILLPAVARDYATEVENFRFYKVALLHQLGFYVFGTFDFRFEENPLAFTAFYRHFDHPALASLLFQILEDARIDWQLAGTYRGISHELAELKADALRRRKDVEMQTEPGKLFESMVLTSLDARTIPDADELLTPAQSLSHRVNELRLPGARIWDTMNAVKACYEIITHACPLLVKPSMRLERPPVVNFRGVMEPDTVSVNLQLGLMEDDDIELLEDDAESLGLSIMLNPGDVEIDDIKQGELESAGMLMKEMDRRPDEAIKPTEKGEAAAGDEATLQALLAGRTAPERARVFRYDEWDCVINDYRRRWCTLHEIRDVDEDPTFVDDALQALRGLSARVRRQLNMLRPEMLAKVRGQVDGEELDMEKAIEAIVDRRAGLSPEERIYIQKQRKIRDVSALFLLDMSASTDDPMPDPNAVIVEPVWVDPDSDDYLREYYAANPELASNKGKRIIDLEKEAVILMAEALQDLGDNYAICGFSGYGREQVEYFIHKDFTENYNRKVKNKIGGIKPCRSTRMGPAIRHASQQLLATESRIKAMIILSDGYPQDFDYGKDRNSRVYGIKDTTRALAEARQQGISVFCLTVDPSGHDYLREMCPDQQYMVIKDIDGLPGELSKVYRGLTA